MVSTGVPSSPDVVPCVRVAGLDPRLRRMLEQALPPGQFRIQALAVLDELDTEVPRETAPPSVVIVTYTLAIRDIGALTRWAERLGTLLVLVPLARRYEAYQRLSTDQVRFVYTPLVGRELAREVERVLSRVDSFPRRLAVSGPTSLEQGIAPLLARVRGASGVIEPPQILNSVFGHTITAVLEALSCRRASILLLDDDHGDLIANGSVLGRGRRIRSHIRLATRGAVTKRLLEGRQPLLVRDVDREFQELDPSSRTYDTRSFMAVPVFLSNRLTLVFNAADPLLAECFEPEHLALLEEIAIRLARLLTSAGDLLPFLRHAAKAQLDSLTRKAQGTAIDSLRGELALTRADLERRNREFEAVREVTLAVKGTFVLEELSRLIIQVCTRVLEAERASLLLIDDERGDLLLRGAIGFREDTSANIRLTERGRVTRRILELGQPLLAQDLESEFNIPRRTEHGYRTGAFMAAPVKIDGVIRAIINVSERRTGGAFTERDLSLLSLLANQVAVALENYFLSQGLVERERLERELQIAQRIQAKVLPGEFNIVGRVRIAAASVPAKEVGGDYYDCFPLDDGAVGVAIGDVSGKGMPAALVMMMLRSLLRVQARHLGSPDRLIESLSELVGDDLEGDMFITLFVGHLDVARGRLRYANAGHCPPYVLRASPASIEPLAQPDGAPIGLFGAVTCCAAEALLSPGDKLVCFTDGVLEADRSRGDLFGSERLEAILLRHVKSPPGALIEAVRAEVQEFMGDRPLPDDFSLVVVELLAGD